MEWLLVDEDMRNTSIQSYTNEHFIGEFLCENS